jgi:hypothetical protein
MILIFIMQMKEQSPVNNVLQISEIRPLIMVRIEIIDVASQH